VLCDGDCVDPWADLDYCGATEGCGAGDGSAGEACPLGEVCVDGDCSPCPAGYFLCDDDCVDPMTDAVHCGATGCGPDEGVACAHGETCQAGACAPAANANAVCPEGATDVTGRGTFTGTTCGGDSEADSCGGRGAPGAYYVADPGTYTMTLTPGFSLQYDAFSCGSGIDICEETPDSSYVFFGVTHYLVVASKSPFTCGAFTLTVE
jgi:hypothetical protein